MSGPMQHLDPQRNPKQVAKCVSSVLRRARPVAFTEPQRAAAPMLSPGTLHRVAGEVFEAPLMAPDKSKKGRKRKRKSASQVPPPTIAQDGPVDNSTRLVHEAGTWMMNDQLLAVANPHMCHIHHACLYIV